MLFIALGAVFPGDKGMDMPCDPLLDKMRLVYGDRSIARNAHGWELRLFLHQMGLNRFLYHLSTSAVFTDSGSNIFLSGVSSCFVSDSSLR